MQPVEWMCCVQNVRAFLWIIMQGRLGVGVQAKFPVYNKIMAVKQYLDFQIRVHYTCQQH